ncbi:MAG: cysteine desulfurase [Rhodospirillales bacterium]|nr:cysteine desulfurase [Rhodospirillales bacterium]
MTLAAVSLADNRGRFDVERARADFPILKQRINGRPLVYLDNAASAQKPTLVLDAMRDVYETTYANVHRGVHTLSQRATVVFEAAREKVARFLNAGSADEIVFVRGATEAINLVAGSLGRRYLAAGDEVVISEMEHHANIVPWQLLREEKGIILRVVPIDDDGVLKLDAYRALLGPRTRLVSIAHVSNALGTVNPVAEIVREAHRAGAFVLIDGCQAVPHYPVDVRELGADFYALSSHKLYGPTSVGVLWGRGEVLAEMPPYQGGGEMIASVSFDKTTFKKPPHRFEAGTPAIAEAVGLGAAVDYLTGLGLAAVHAHEDALLAYATRRLGEVPGLRIIGTAPEKAAIVSFVMDGVHPHDIGTIVDQYGVAIRAGHHCAQPVMDRFGVAATARASFALYNTMAEVDALTEALAAVRELFPA